MSYDDELDRLTALLMRQFPDWTFQQALRAAQRRLRREQGTVLDTMRIMDTVRQANRRR